MLTPTLKASFLTEPTVANGFQAAHSALQTLPGDTMGLQGLAQAAAGNNVSGGKLGMLGLAQVAAGNNVPGGKLGMLGLAQAASGKKMPSGKLGMLGLAQASAGKNSLGGKQELLGFAQDAAFRHAAKKAARNGPLAVPLASPTIPTSDLADAAGGEPRPRRKPRAASNSRDSGSGANGATDAPSFQQLFEQLDQSNSQLALPSAGLAGSQLALPGGLKVGLGLCPVVISAGAPAATAPADASLDAKATQAATASGDEYGQGAGSYGEGAGVYGQGEGSSTYGQGASAYGQEASSSGPGEWSQTNSAVYGNDRWGHDRWGGPGMQPLASPFDQPSVTLSGCPIFLVPAVLSLSAPSSRRRSEAFL